MADPLDAIRWRDELLQILYWYRGEGLGEDVGPTDLVPFLSTDAALVHERLVQLIEEGYVVAADTGPGRYRLTDRGIAEGGRRFADEFAGLTGQAHGECNNPNCSCQTLGPAACEAHLAHAR